MAVKRIPMPDSYLGTTRRRVSARFVCECGHLHPSRALAIRCNQRHASNLAANQPLTGRF